MPGTQFVKVTKLSIHLAKKEQYSFTLTGRPSMTSGRLTTDLVHHQPCPCKSEKRGRQS